MADGSWGREGQGDVGAEAPAGERRPLDAEPARRWRRHVRAFFEGAAAGPLLAMLVVLAHAAGRYVFASHEAEFGRPKWQLFVGGLVDDIVAVGPVFVVAVVLPALIALAARRPRARRAARIASMTLGGLVLASVMVFTIAAIETKLERGLYPTFMEARMALSSRAFVVTTFPVLFKTKYLVLGIPSVALSAHGLWVLGRRVVPSWRRWPALLGSVAGFAAVYGVAGVALARDDVFFPDVGAEGPLCSPLAPFFRGFLPSMSAASPSSSLRTVFAEYRGTPDGVVRGANALGYSRAHADAVIAADRDAAERGVGGGAPAERGGPAECTRPHPLASPLVLADEDRALLRPPARELRDSIAGLSSAIFAGGEPSDLVVLQLFLESMRSHEIHALNPDAPEGVTPFLDRLFTDGRSIVFPRAYQAGIRTPHGVSAMLCGVGLLPVMSSVVRDLGKFPLRCMPDVLVDAGFDAHFTFGGDLTFDNFGEFFRYHGVRTTEAGQLPRAELVGSVHNPSDRSIERIVTNDLSARHGLRYEMLLTMSGHAPYRFADDGPPEVRARIEAICEHEHFGTDDCNHLLSAGYVDWSLSELFADIERSPLASKIVVVAAGDHSTADPFPWAGSEPASSYRARVPMFVSFGSGVLARGGDDARAHLAKANAVAQSMPVSNADIPAVMLDLLSAHPAMSTIDPKWRWHTLGGMSLSPFTRLAEPEARVAGTNTAAELFTVDDAMNMRLFQKNKSLVEPSQMQHLAPLVEPQTSFLGALLRGYASTCIRTPIRAHH